METERREVEKTPEEIKAKILREALYLRDEWHADSDEWITPADYALKQDDKETRNAKTKKLNKKRLNKYIHGWFSMIFGDIIQPMRSLPPEDPLKMAVGQQMEVFWKLKESDDERIESGEERMLEEFLGSEDFKMFCNDPRMCPDVCEIGKGDIYLYTCLRQGAVNLMFDYIWKFEAVQKAFNFIENDFNSYFADKVTPLVDKLQAMKRQYVARAPEVVKSGDEILTIVIKELQK